MEAIQQIQDDAAIAAIHLSVAVCSVCSAGKSVGRFSLEAAGR